MKWNFFYDEGEGKPYESFQDWIDEIRHLIWPTIIMSSIIIFLLVYFKVL